MDISKFRRILLGHRRRFAMSIYCFVLFLRMYKFLCSGFDTDGITAISLLPSPETPLLPSLESQSHLRSSGGDYFFLQQGVPAINRAINFHRLLNRHAPELAEYFPRHLLRGGVVPLEYRGVPEVLLRVHDLIRVPGLHQDYVYNLSDDEVFDMANFAAALALNADAIRDFFAGTRVPLYQIQRIIDDSSYARVAEEIVWNNGMTSKSAIRMLTQPRLRTSHRMNTALTGGIAIKSQLPLPGHLGRL